MASRISGITIEIGGDTTKLSDALKGVNSELKETSAKLKDVERALKFDPGNVELLSQKQKYLGEAIEETQKKLQQEKEALEQLDARSAAGEDVTDQQEALQREIAETEGSLKNLQAQSDTTGRSMADDFKDAQQQVDTLGSKLESAGDKMQKTGDNIQYAGHKISDVGGAIDQSISQPLKQVADASVDAWREVDEALDTVATKTGASGEALADMQDRMEDVATTIPTSFQAAGDAIGEVNTRFGLTGDALQDLSTDFIKFAQLNDTDVSSSIDSVQAAMAAMNVDTKDASLFLDTLNKAGQDTGVSVTGLADEITKNGAALNDMGYSASDATFFLANLSKSGVDSSKVMTGLKTAFKNSAKEGKSMSDNLAEFNKVMESNASDADKSQAAIDLFGAKAGASIYQFCSTGKLNFNDLGTSMSDYAENVNSTWEETQDPLDQMTVVQNNLKEVGAELVDTAGPMIIDMMQQTIPIIKDLKDGWDSLPPGMQEFIVKAGLVGIAAGPLITQIGNVTTAMGGLIQGGGKVISKFGELISKSSETGTALGNVAGAGGGGKLISFLTSDVSSACSTMTGTLGTAGLAVGTFAASFEFTQAILQLTGLDDKLSEVGSDIYDFFHKADEEAADTSNKALQHATEVMQKGGDVQGAVRDLDDAIAVTSGNEQASLQKLRDAMVQKYGESATASANAAGTIQNSGSQMDSSLNSSAATAENSGNRMKNAMSGASSSISGSMSSAKKDVSSSVGSMSRTITGANFTFPRIKLPHFSISGKLSLDPPSIPHISVSWYKKAMDDAYLLNSPTIFGMSGGKLLGGGEAGQEAVVGTDKLRDIVTEAVAGIGGGTTIIPVYIGQDRIDEIVVKASQRANYRSGGR